MEALAVIWAPMRTLARVAEERRVLLGFVIVALSAILGLISASLAVFGNLTQARLQSGGQEPPPGFSDLLPVINALSVVLEVALPFVIWLLVSGLMQLVTRFFGGNGPFSGMLAVVGLSQVPLAIARAIQIPLVGLQVLLETGGSASTIVGLLGSLLGLAALLWFAALVVTGAAFARRIGYGESAGSCAISCVGCAGLIVLVFVIIIAVLVVVAGAFDSAGTT